MLEAISCLSSCLRNGFPAPLPGSMLAVIFPDIIVFIRHFCRERTFIIKKSFVFEIRVFYVILLEFCIFFKWCNAERIVLLLILLSFRCSSPFLLRCSFTVSDIDTASCSLPVTVETNTCLSLTPLPSPPRSTF